MCEGSAKDGKDTLQKPWVQTYRSAFVGKRFISPQNALHNARWRASRENIQSKCRPKFKHPRLSTHNLAKTTNRHDQVAPHTYQQAMYAIYEVDHRSPIVGTLVTEFATSSLKMPRPKIPSRFIALVQSSCCCRAWSPWTKIAVHVSMHNMSVPYLRADARVAESASWIPFCTTSSSVTACLVRKKVVQSTTRYITTSRVFYAHKPPRQQIDDILQKIKNKCRVLLRCHSICFPHFPTMNALFTCSNGKYSALIA